MNINLARKWRSKTFDELVGQPLAVRLVKNSLYRNLLFPVYLLSGTRGTGKTSTARIFAAALNCKQLKAFQKDPKNNPLPCLSCESCTAMQQMNHPDVIEIDAASHTGVDNVRQIIEAASFVPVLGGKKIYLIDEAHMLSKAAFNAFLKILEEPPESVVFMLVTTDPHKIIPTVLSRCFQIFFDPIKPADVVNHLTFICEQEGLSAEPEALMLIAQETEGCMRDALNLLERLRAIPEVMKNDTEQAVITKEIISGLLGNVDDERIGELLYAVVTADAQEVLATWQRLEMTRFSPILVWKKLVETLRRALWLKQNIVPDELPVAEPLRKALDSISYERLIALLDLCYSYEWTFSKTAVPGTLLEVLLLKMVGPQKSVHEPVHSAATPSAPRAQTKAAPSLQAQPVQAAKKAPVKAAPAKAPSVEAVAAQTEPTKAEPAKAESKKAPQGEATPAKAEPAAVASKAEAAQVPPSEAKPKKVVPAKAAPEKTIPAKIESVKSEPINAEAVKVEPAKVAPVKEVPKAEPVKAEAVKAVPTKVEPAKVEPAKVEPAKVEPVVAPEKEVPKKVAKKEEKVQAAQPAEEQPPTPVAQAQAPSPAPEESKAVQSAKVAQPQAPKEPEEYEEPGQPQPPAADQKDTAQQNTGHQDAGTTEGTWGTCLEELKTISDPLVISIFTQSSKQVYKENEATLELTFSQDLLFFKDWLSNTKKVWSPIIQKFYGEKVLLVPQFDGASKPARPAVAAPTMSLQAASQAQQPIRKPQKQVQEPVGKAVSPDTVKNLKTGSMVTKMFPGRVTAQDIPSSEGA